MPRELVSCERAVLEELQRAAVLACCLDYDGTLAPIAPTPEEARPLPGTVALVERLVRARATEVAIVSGRTVDDLRRCLDVPGVVYIGVHGLEWLRPGERLERAAVASRVVEELPAIRRQLEAALGSRPGIRLEDKGLTLAVHYRLASRPDARRAHETVERLVAACRARGVPLDVLRGHEVSEIRPAGANKGRAVVGLLAGRHPEPLVLYIGDDRTDEEAFQSLPASAVTVRVGPPEVETAARYRLGDPAAVQAFLRQLVKVRA